MIMKIKVIREKKERKERTIKTKREREREREKERESQEKQRLWYCCQLVTELTGHVSHDGIGSHICIIIS